MGSAEQVGSDRAFGLGWVLAALGGIALLVSAFAGGTSAAVAGAVLAVVGFALIAYSSRAERRPTPASPSAGPPVDPAADPVGAPDLLDRPVEPIVPAPIDAVEPRSAPGAGGPSPAPWGAAAAAPGPDAPFVPPGPGPEARVPEGPSDVPSPTTLLEPAPAPTAAPLAVPTDPTSAPPWSEEIELRPPGDAQEASLELPVEAAPAIAGVPPWSEAEEPSLAAAMPWPPVPIPAPLAVPGELEPGPVGPGPLDPPGGVSPWALVPGLAFPSGPPGSLGAGAVVPGSSVPLYASPEALPVSRSGAYHLRRGRPEELSRRPPVPSLSMLRPTIPGPDPRAALIRVPEPPSRGMRPPGRCSACGEPSRAGATGENRCWGCGRAICPDCFWRYGPGPSVHRCMSCAARGPPMTVSGGRRTIRSGPFSAVEDPDWGEGL